MTFIIQVTDAGSIKIPLNQEIASGFVGLILNATGNQGPEFYDGNNERGIKWNLSAIDGLGASRERVVLNVNGTEVLQDAAQTLSAKTLAAPKMSSLQQFESNAAAITGGLVAGDIYISAGTDPALLAIVT